MTEGNESVVEDVVRHELAFVRQLPRVWRRSYERTRGEFDDAQWRTENRENSVLQSNTRRAALGSLYPDFPLLFKMRLSVWVHPNKDACKVTDDDLILR